MHFDPNALGTEFPFDVFHFSSIDSTSRYLKDEITQGKIKKPTFCIADEQTAGYGQRERSWNADKALSPLTCSFTFSVDYPLDKLLLKSVPVALILHRLLSKYSQGNYQVKWPNDIYANGLKAAGCLIELVKADKRMYVVFGLGINLSAPNDSLYGFVKELDIYHFLTEFGNELITFFMSEETEVAKKIISDWRDVDYFSPGELVIVEDKGEHVKGRYYGLNNFFQPQVQIDGELKSFMTGQVSIRKII
ncbi:biotin--[acetyl-CoA-carboxylase] ligase [Hydrogenovibrio kuenenii]|uniref:biotin--[acetyl-CoA-carboxylase] ligase n=1 Tax=Hydrogenovibrio kuenenii TaxID=63658 RepID=UPI000463DDC3|nr:biotin--[acetyl-CoA-carboxylase] ligase [Hydrogenovibrio kuenenii]